MSADLQWLLLRKSNAFIVKAVPEGPILSSEPGNLLNIHSYKYSGLANNKSIDISTGAEGNVVITTKTANGSKVASTYSSVSLRKSTGSRRAAKIAAAQTAGKSFRADLRSAAVARASTLVRAQNAAAAPKTVKARSARGKKASAVAEDAEDLE